MSAKRASRFAAVLVTLTGMAVGAAPAGCSRTGLSDLESLPPGGDLTSSTVDAGVAIPPADAAVDALVPPPVKPPPVKPPPVKPPPVKPHGCTPHDETCNGVDDDCNGDIDENLPAIPCAGGGERYCIAGRYSACPTRCDACIPGSERVCFLSYCTYWAVQTCAADGRSFGVCRERHVPPECEAVSSAHKDSAALEQCCVDKGYCCRDEYDLDGDGNTDEMVGSCSEVSCQ